MSTWASLFDLLHETYRQIRCPTPSYSKRMSQVTDTASLATQHVAHLLQRARTDRWRTIRQNAGQSGSEQGSRSSETDGGGFFTPGGGESLSLVQADGGSCAPVCGCAVVGKPGKGDRPCPLSLAHDS